MSEVKSVYQAGFKAGSEDATLFYQAQEIGSARPEDLQDAFGDGVGKVGAARIDRHGQIMSDAVSLKPCPFCGGEAKFGISDAEGNTRDEEYEQDPWSGLSYTIEHAHETNEGCPIAKYEEDGAMMGVYLYESREEAAEAWNRRNEP